MDAVSEPIAAVVYNVKYNTQNLPRAAFSCNLHRYLVLTVTYSYLQVLTGTYSYLHSLHLHLHCNFKLW